MNRSERHHSARASSYVPGSSFWSAAPRCSPERPSSAQEAFPTRPIQLVVPQAPGGAADLHARPLAQAMERILKQPVLVINKPGAGSVMGIQFVASSGADGYTMLVAMPGFFITPPVDALFGRTPKFKTEQFTPIARLSAEPLVLVVHPARPWKSVADLVAEARRRPGDISYGSSGLYTSLHLQMEILAASTGVTLKHVPYNGAGPAVVALLGGHIDAMASGPGPVLKNIKSGALRALATSGDKRLATLSRRSDVQGTRTGCRVLPAGRHRRA